MAKEIRPFVKSSSVKKVVLVCFLLLILSESAEECDFVKCITRVRSLILDLSLSTRAFDCRKLSNMPWCSEPCMDKYFKNDFSHSKHGHQSFTKYCEENISYRLNVRWSCIARHIYRLFTCLVNVNSLTAHNVRIDMVTESCRKYLEFQGCSKQILFSDCGEESSDVVKDLIFYVLDNYQAVSCKGANVKEVLSMPVSYQLGSDFIDAAKSLDDHHLTVHNCLTQLIQDEIDLNEYLCGDYDPDIDACVNHVLSKNGKPHPDVKRLLLKTIALSGFKCKVFNIEPIPVITLDSSELVKLKPDDYYSLKDNTISNLDEITSKNIKTDNVDLKLSESFTNIKFETETETPIKDSFDFNENTKIINLSDSVNKNSKKHRDQNVKSLNVSYRTNLSVHTLFFYCMFLLFIFM